MKEKTCRAKAYTLRAQFSSYDLAREINNAVGRQFRAVFDETPQYLEKVVIKGVSCMVVIGDDVVVVFEGEY